MSKCANCGAEIMAGKNFCTQCGARADAPVYTPPAVIQPQGDIEPAPGSRYEPISTFSFIGIMLLMCIPIVGQILVLIWAFGGCKKVNKRNFARASLFFMIISLIFGIFVTIRVKRFVDKVNQNIHAVTGQVADNLNLEEIADLLTGVENVASGHSDDAEGVISDIGSFVGEKTELDGEDVLSFLGALSEGTGKENEGLDADALAALAALAGSNASEKENSSTAETAGSLDELITEIESINEEAAAKASGWPSSLPDYPDGTMKSVETYRTEISGTSLETMREYIETLKNKGYEFQDFYDLGMSEQDMLGMNGWWGTNGNLYLSLSYYEGTVTIDHMTELPDLSSLLGG